MGRQVQAKKRGSAPDRFRTNGTPRCYYNPSKTNRSGGSTHSRINQARAPARFSLHGGPRRPENKVSLSNDKSFHNGSFHNGSFHQRSTATGRVVFGGGLAPLRVALDKNGRARNERNRRVGLVLKRLVLIFLNNTVTTITVIVDGKTCSFPYVIRHPQDMIPCDSPRAPSAVRRIGRRGPGARTAGVVAI